ncbi:hypothetical protein AHAS_Ahas20G0256700 [Arachis hypogaea]
MSFTVMMDDLRLNYEGWRQLTGSLRLSFSQSLRHGGERWNYGNSGSEGNSDFSGQWTDGWSNESDEEKVSKGLDSPSRVGKESEPVERVDVSGEADEGGTMPSSESPEAYEKCMEYAKAIRFVVQKEDSIKDDESNVVRKFFYCNRQRFREKKHYERADRKRLGPTAMRTHRNINEGNKAHIHSMHKYDYECFSDLLAFDLTNRKNIYNLPLVMFSGTNYHRQTIIFGFELLEDEKIRSYKWLLDTFLEVMHQKQPKVMVTDGDESMKEAIRAEFSNATHRLYTWHLAWNAISNIKDNNFCDAFKTAVYGHFEVEEID